MYSIETNLVNFFVLIIYFVFNKLILHIVCGYENLHANSVRSVMILQEKDAFEEYYKRHLARRLLNQKSASGMYGTGTVPM